ncbi:oxidoreductase [Corynebacterium mendelii]|uniref:Oxidoreductase n=1 Tax=Corynebacterium mendelii TaxID=2765362 RepID=A0A939IW58_9CORY|nr:oxidoreductase [Corynebacterium mendelii]
MFDFLKGRKKKDGLAPPRGPGGKIRDHDLFDLRNWARGRAFVEAFVEPETLVNEMSVVVVDENGDFIRRPIGGPKGIDIVAAELACPIYDVEETGYPQRMRERIERERILRKRAEAAERRRRFEEGKNPYGGSE